MVDYREELVRDLVEQFKGKPIIEALVETIGEQLNEVRDFFEALRTERSVKTAVGKQLDGVGDIVCLDRYEATELACAKESAFSLDDEVYREYLIYKIWKNTNICTYYDILKALRMFWDKPLYYTEDPAFPATILWEVPTERDGGDPYIVNRFPIVRSAGVGTKFLLSCNIGIIINTSMRGYVYHTPRTGKLECGTEPWRNKRGRILDDEIVIETDTSKYRYTSPYAGTVPWRDTRAGIEDSDVQIDSSSNEWRFTSAFTGKVEAGTEPWRSQRGAVERGSIVAETEARHFGYDTPEAGTKPYRNVTPATADGSVEVEAEAFKWSYRTKPSGKVAAGTKPKRAFHSAMEDGSVSINSDAEGFPYKVASTGDHSTGTKPSRSTMGDECDGAFFAETDGEGFKYHVKWCGTSYCKS